MSDADEERLTGNDQRWSSEKHGWWKDEQRDDDDNDYTDNDIEPNEFCELAPQGEMSVGAGRVDSPSPQDIRLLHDLVEDLAKDQDDKSKPLTEQVRETFM